MTPQPAVESLFDRVTKTLGNSRLVDAIDIVYEELDALLFDHKTEEVERVLSASLDHVDTLPLSVFISLLTVTLPERGTLVGRTALIELLRARAVALQGEEYATRLLQGLD